MNQGSIDNRLRRLAFCGGELKINIVPDMNIVFDIHRTIIFSGDQLLINKGTSYGLKTIK